MKMTTKAALIALGLALAGCATPPSGQGLPQASAEAELFRSEMVIDPRDNGLTYSQLAQLDAIATEYKARGHGPLVISYPQGANNEQAAMHAVANARNVLFEAGLNWQQISGGAYQAYGDGNGALVFSFTRYRAIAPDCPDGWDDLTPSINANQRYQRFGCSMAANIAAMVADPRDLITPRTMEPGDTGRRQTVIDAYRQGQATASQSSGQDSGAVSSVGN
ncbi:MAG: pilus assembly protein CpaD [Alphaproteobacteria bacterium]|nr:pilus assembly protein CpaD [Alphaproteobacteria bacterium]